MPSVSSDAPTTNANFAATVIHRAAEIIAGNTANTKQGCDALGAFRQARDEFIAAETNKQAKRRTYHWSLLLKDIGQYVKSREPAYADSFSPIVEWSAATDADIVAQTLREAALPISRMVAERTIWASRFESMSEQEKSEYELMRKVSLFLKEHGLTVQTAWDREDPSDPIDYRAVVDGVAWAFELTELRIDVEDAHVKIGHPNEGKSVKQQLEELVAPLPQVPDGPDTLQKALNKAAEHGSKKSKVAALNGAKYCLVLNNRLFLYAPDWDAIALPDYSAFDAVLVMHQEIYPLVQTWEIMRNGFAKLLRSHNVSDLGDIIAFKNSNRTRRSDTERVKAALRHLEALELTEDDIRAAIAETRAERNSQ